MYTRPPISDSDMGRVSSLHDIDDGPLSLIACSIFIGNRLFFYSDNPNLPRGNPKLRFGGNGAGACIELQKDRDALGIAILHCTPENDDPGCSDPIKSPQISSSFAIVGLLSPYISCTQKREIVWIAFAIVAHARSMAPLRSRARENAALRDDCSRCFVE